MQLFADGIQNQAIVSVRGEAWRIIPDICFDNSVCIGMVELITNIPPQRATRDVGDLILVEHIINFTLRFDAVD